MRTTHHALFLSCLIATTLPTHASPWPWADGMTIVCNDGSSNCFNNLTYSWTGVKMVDAPSNVHSPYSTTSVYLYGVHCDRGARPGEFSHCVFTEPNVGNHAPALLGVCETTTPNGWELTPSSTCSIRTGPFAAGHAGAYIGAECALFAKGPRTGNPRSVSTPWGDVIAETVANTYSTYCSKAPPPNQECHITLPNDGVINHGTLPPTGSDTRQIRADVACGDNAIISIAGGGELDLGDGVRSRVSVSPVVGGSANIVSVLTLTNAKPGPRSGVLVVNVSPQ